MKWLVSVLVLIPLCSVQADTLITMREGSGKTGAERVVDPGSGGLAGQEVQIWSGKGNMARVNSSGKMVFSIDRGMTFMLNDENKTCNAFKHPERSEADPAPANEIAIRETGETRKVGPWDADGYIMSVPLEGMESALEVNFWVADELTTGFETYRANFAAMATPQTAWIGKTLELGGYPVYQEARMGQMTMWSEVLSVSEEQAPDGIYEVPAGYSGCSDD